MTYSQTPSKVVHRRKRAGPGLCELPGFIDRSTTSFGTKNRIPVNKQVYNISLFDEGNLIVSKQFIERTEADKNGRKNVAEGFEDNPRRLGKGWVRLVWLNPSEIGPQGRV
jgi:hypothetical protein